MKEMILKAKDGYNLTVHVFEAENPKAIIEVAHGMEEHQERYEDFANYLVSNGYTVVTADMRGHGKNAEVLGYFNNDNAAEQLVYDQLVIKDFIKEIYKDKDIYLFAHSMGTIIARNTLLKNSKEFKKVCLSGYPNYQPAAGIGKVLAKLIKAIKGDKYKAPLLESMSVGAFNKAVKNPKTSVDWLSYDEDNVKTYIEDPLCGDPFTTNAYIALFTLVQGLNNKNAFENVNTDCPMLLVSGKDDPCTGGEKGRESSLKFLKDGGFKNIEVITYDNMRHEILNETNKKQVYEDVLNFFNK